MHERRGGADEIVQVLRLCVLPYEGTAEIWWIIRLDAKPNDAASIVESVAASGYCGHGLGKRASVEDAGLSGPLENVNRSILE